jgi:hypothetical protein
VYGTRGLPSATSLRPWCCDMQARVPKVKAFRERLAKVIPDKHQSTMTKLGAILVRQLCVALSPLAPCLVAVASWHVACYASGDEEGASIQSL